MSEKSPTGDASATASQPAKWWCNFCDFKTNDQKAYLAHSCADELKRQGRSAASSGKNACG